MRGKAKPNASVHAGTGHVSTSMADIAEAERALSAKYGWQFKEQKLWTGSIDDSAEDKFKKWSRSASQYLTD
jgi:hypothetical protein